MSEFINPLSNSICVFSGEYDKIRKFTDEVIGLKDKKDEAKAANSDDKKKAEKKPDPKGTKKWYWYSFYTLKIYTSMTHPLENLIKAITHESSS